MKATAGLFRTAVMAGDRQPAGSRGGRGLRPLPPHGSVCKLDKQPGCKPGAIGIGGSNPSRPTRCELVIRLRPRVRARCSTTLDEGTVPSPAFNRALGWFDSDPSALRRVVEPLGPIGESAVPATLSRLRSRVRIPLGPRGWKIERRGSALAREWCKRTPSSDLRSW